MQSFEETLKLVEQSITAPFVQNTSARPPRHAQRPAEDVAPRMLLTPPSDGFRRLLTQQQKAAQDENDRARGRGLV